MERRDARHWVISPFYSNLDRPYLPCPRPSFQSFVQTATPRVASPSVSRRWQGRDICLLALSPCVTRHARTNIGWSFIVIHLIGSILVTVCGDFFLRKARRFPKALRDPYANVQSNDDVGCPEGPIICQMLRADKVPLGDLAKLMEGIARARIGTLSVRLHSLPGDHVTQPAPLCENL